MKNKLFNFLWLENQKKLIGIILISLVLSAIQGYLTPVYISKFYASYEERSTFFYFFYFLLFLFIFEYVIKVIYQTTINKYVQHLLQKIRTDSFRKWILSYEAFSVNKKDKDKYPLGEVISRIMTDTEAVMELISSGSFSIIIDFIFIISCLISFMFLNSTSGLFLIVAEVLACVFLIWASKFMAKVYMEVRQSSGTMSKVLANVSSGMRSMFYTPHGNFAVKKSEKSFDDFLQKQLKANIWDASYFSLAESLFPILLLLLVVIVPYSNIVEMAIIAAIIDLIQRSITPIKDIASKISSIQRAKAAVIRIFEFNEDLEKGFSSDFVTEYTHHDFESLELNVPEFFYSEESKDEFCLRNISLNAKRGDIIGIVGLSGSGKSTLLKILSTDIISPNSEINYKADGKNSLFKGSSLKDLQDFRKQVSIISQDSHVFTSDFKFNVTLGKENELNFEEFLSDMKKKIPYLEKWGIHSDTLIDPNTISLGQKQLISALRSCYLTKPIVLFDEVSSGLDSELEYALRQAILLIQKYSLTIIVAHRIETVIGANEILVMQNGEIKDRGTHINLLENSAEYQEFIKQLKDET